MSRDKQSTARKAAAVPRAGGSKAQTGRKQTAIGKAGVYRVTSNTSATISTRDLGAAMRPGVDLKKGKYPGLGYQEREKEGILIQKDVTIPLRDGTRLYANVYRPKGRAGIPAIICYAPFGKHNPVEMEKTFAGSEVPFEKL